jgi:CDP-diglyceride synthetase
VNRVAVVVALVFACLCIFTGKQARDRNWIASGICYAAVIAFFPPFLREMPMHGLSNILWVFAVVWATDIAAYFVGRTFGGPKLWPRVSPNKTWSGFFGGLVFGTLAGVSLVMFLQRDVIISQQLPWLLITLFSAVASILSQGGDLAESSLKRHFGVKDSSFLIPGHGGVMDRLDGFWSAVFFLGMCLIFTHMAYSWTY